MHEFQRQTKPCLPDKVVHVPTRLINLATIENGFCVTCSRIEQLSVNIGCKDRLAANFFKSIESDPIDSADGLKQHIRNAIAVVITGVDSII